MNDLIAHDMFTLRGTNEIERMDAQQLADHGIERQGDIFVRDGKVVHEIPRVRTFLRRLLANLTSEPVRLKAVRA